jgi:hypothetical protein
MASKRLIGQRKRIADDVQLQIATARLFASQGDYLSLPKHTYELAEIADKYYSQYLKGDLYRVETKYVTPKKCNVCGIGALFITSVDRYNKIMVSDTSWGIDSTEMLPHLSRWWNDQELRLIEVAFEGNIIDMPDSLTDSNTDKAYEARTAWRLLAKRATAWRTKIHNRYYELTDASKGKWNGVPNYTLHYICQTIIRHPEGIFRP